MRSPMLADSKVVAFGATMDGPRAVEFYRDTLGLPLRSQDSFAIVFDVGEAELRIQLVERFTPQPFTSLGWQVDDVTAVLTSLASRGVSLERYAWLEQDDRGIWTAPSGARVAWFKDPDGNLLSVAQYPIG